MSVYIFIGYDISCSWLWLKGLQLSKKNYFYNILVNSMYNVFLVLNFRLLYAFETNEEKNAFFGLIKQKKLIQKFEHMRSISSQKIGNFVELWNEIQDLQQFAVVLANFPKNQTKQLPSFWWKAHEYFNLCTKNRTIFESISNWSISDLLKGITLESFVALQSYY